jgi:23S rRNA (uracil1939-C5)-methyltransferase
MGYQAQSELKQKEVVDSLSRIGGIELPEITPILGCKNEFRYRNKMDYAFTKRRWITIEESAGGEEITCSNGVGLRVAGFWDKVVDLNECHLQAEPSNAIRKFARDYANKHKLEFFDIAEKEGFLRNLMAGEIMTLFQFFYENKGKERACSII